METNAEWMRFAFGPETAFNQDVFHGFLSTRSQDHFPLARHEKKVLQIMFDAIGLIHVICDIAEAPASLVF